MSTALVLSGGGFQGLGLVRALQQLNDVRVIVSDIHAEHLVRYVCPECLISPPLADEAAFASFLFHTVQREHVDVIFPATAYELPALSRMKKLLALRGATAAVSTEGLIDILLDKQRTQQFLRDADQPVAELFDPRSHDYKTPLFGRPRRGWGGRDTLLLHNHDEADAHPDDADDYVWSKWLPAFEEFSADFAIGQRGDLSPIALRRRVRTSGGFAVISESVSDPNLIGVAKRAATALAAAQGCGIYNVQLILPPSGPAFISDVNPRIGTSATHALAEGINLPGFFLDSVNAPPTRILPKRKFVKTVRVLADITVPLLERPPQGIVFDLDDTLVDHKTWILKKLDLIYPQVFSRQLPRDIFLLAAAQLIDEGERASLIDRLLTLLSLPSQLRIPAIEAYRAATVPDTPLFADVEPILIALKAANLPMAILTDNPPETQRSKISNAPALNCIDAVICTREYGKEKPAPPGFMGAARSLKLDPAQLVMIGDNFFRDGVGAVTAGYMHALIICRRGIFMNPSNSLMSVVSGETREHIDVLADLVSARHACLGS